MTPDQAVTMMISAYPSLYQSYTDVIYKVMTKYDASWDSDGNITFDESEYPAYVPDKIPEDYDQLFWIMEQAQHQALVDNVHLVIQKNSIRFSNFSQQVPSDKLRLFDQEIPENVNQEWVDAFLFVIANITHYRFPAGKFDSTTDDFKNGYYNRLTECQVSAQKAKIKLDGTDAEKQQLKRDAHIKAIDALLKSAAADGFNFEVVEKNP